MQPDLTRQDLNDNWAARPADEVLQSLHTTRRGLEQEEALARLIRFGANQLPEQKQPGFWSKMLAQFNNALIYVLLGATVLTALMQHWIDTWVILGVVIINALIGYIQEEKAQKALDSIKHLLSLKAAVLRGGSRHEVPAEALVPGDIVLLAAGDKIPADVRLIEVSRFSVEESSLTGESEAVDKATEPVEQDTLLGDRRSMAYTGTTVRAGSAVGVVVATASATELGKINTLLAETETMTTPLIRKINRFGQLLSVIIVLFSALLFAFAVWLRHYPISEAIMAVIGLAVAAIPEGLPAILTITLAIGVQRMAQRRAIIRRLPSVETLGSVTVICSDKTGTLTRNEMTVQAIYTTGGMYEVSGAGYEPHGEIRLDGHPVAARQDPILSRLLQAAALCNDAEIGQDDQGQWEVRGTPTEGALKTLAVKAGADTEGQRLAGLPFDSQIKYRATVHQVGDTYLLFANGAPERLLSLCTRQLEPDGTSPVDLAFWERQIETGAASGLRLLGSAYRLLDGPVQSISDDLLAEGLVFIGITGIMS
jgi:magnesium-transporting ATPase (P-type)